MTPQELKNSILQLAIQGKLVEQRAEEGTAAELLEKILAAKDAKSAKKNLTRSRRARGEKETSALSASPREKIPDDEKPFDIPESWEWVRLGDLGSLKSGYAFKSTEYTKDGIQVVRISDLSDDSIGLKDAVFYPRKPELSQYLVVDGSFLICMTGSIGKMAWVKDSVLRYLNQRVGMFIPNALCSPTYLWLFLHTSYVIDKWISAKTSTNGNIKNSDIVELLIPLPPLAEQKRIVAKIEEMLPLIDRYEKAWSKLEDFNRRFPVDMQKSVLQMAIQGKLVEQRPEEGTAAELLEKILATKNAKGAKGNLTRSRGARGENKTSALSASPREKIPDDEIPFEIPESWEWVRLGEVFNIVNGFTPLKSNPEFWTKGEIPWFTINDVHRQGRFITTTEKYITKKALSKGSERIVPSDTVLLCCTASIGEYAFTKIPLATNQQFNALVVKEPYCNLIDPLFVFEFVKTLKGKLIELAGKTTFNFVSVGKVSKILFPLPPLAEQKRIVAKLEEILPLCERLK